MGHIPLLDELATIAVLGVAVTIVLARIRLPAVAGLLLAGALAGPSALGLVPSVASISILAELGVVLLLFTIGLEFSLNRLREVFKQVALGGALQVGLTTVVVMGGGVALGLPIKPALFFGFVFAMSSTAIVLRALTERRELDAPHGRFIVGTLIFQDLCVVPMVLVVPLLGPANEGVSGLGAIGLALGKAVAVVVGVVVLARIVVPWGLNHVDRSRSREGFLLAVLGLCIGTAWFTAHAGLSLALGAFLGGMAVADTEYGHRAMGDVLPLRDAFMSVFFVSLGMLFDVRVLVTHGMAVALLTAAFIFGKGAVATAAAMVMRFPSRVAWLAGVGLAQFGEFGFVLAELGRESRVVDSNQLAPVMAAGILSMFFTPLLVRAAPHVSAGEKLLAPLARLLRARGIEEVDASPLEAPEKHVVIVGFGVTGQLLARTLEACGIRSLALELNADTVRAAREAGRTVYYGDATSAEALGHAGLERARALVLVMNDPSAAQRVIDTAKRVAPQVPILLRTHYLAERPRLLELGATDVVAEEVEASVEMVVRLLRWMQLPRNVIEQRVREARESTHTSERRITIPRRTLGEMHALADLKLESLVLLEHSPAVGRSAIELDLRRRTGALIIAVQRGTELLEQPDPASPFMANDVVFLVGRNDAIREAQTLLAPPRGP